MRTLLILTIAISLLLCLAALGVWVRSYWVYDLIRLSRTQGIQYHVTLRSGSMLVARSALTGRTSTLFSDSYDRGPGWAIESHPAPRPRVSPFTEEGSPPIVQWFGFDFLAHDTSTPGFGTFTFRRIIVPMWLPVLLAALPIVPLARRVRRGKQRSAGLCMHCGYDLRATPGRCPECGRAISDDASLQRIGRSGTHTSVERPTVGGSLDL